MQILKDKKTRIILLIAAAIIVLIAFWYFFLRKKNPKLISENATDVATTQNAEDPFPLKLGKQGKEIEQLQTYLLTKYGAQFPQFGIDGVWGDETENNVRKFLKKDSVSRAYFSKVGIDKYRTTKFA